MKFTELQHRLDEANKFVTEHPHGNIFQRGEMFEVYQKTKHYIPFYYGVVDSQNEILGVISGVIQKNYYWPLNTLTSRAIIQGGPLVINNNKNTLHFLLTEYNKTIKHKAIYSQYRNMFEWGNLKSTFSNCGYTFEPHLDIIINIHQPKEELLKRISKNKRRNIVKSTNKGTKLRFIDNYDEYMDAIQLIYSTYKRVGLPLSDSSFFKHIYDKLFKQGLVKILVAEFNNQIIGIRIVLLFKGLIYDWYAGSDDNHKNKYPNDFLPYHILLWGNENKYRSFDFGGAGKPGIEYGVREHKLKFGGDLVEHGRFEKTHKPLLMTIGKLGFKLYKKL